jgi:subtilase family serine protease
MMDSMPQQEAISVQLAKIGLRGTTVVAAAGDGGSHFSFVMFPNDRIGNVLNEISCQYNFPTFPASSPNVLGVGGTQWEGASPDQPIGWSSGGSGFSWQFPTPSYQTSFVESYLAAQNGTNGFPAYGNFNAGGRAYPDVVR